MHHRHNLLVSFDFVEIECVCFIWETQHHHTMSKLINFIDVNLMNKWLMPFMLRFSSRKLVFTHHGTTSTWNPPIFFQFKKKGPSMKLQDNSSRVNNTNFDFECSTTRLFVFENTMSLKNILQPQDTQNHSPTDFYDSIAHAYLVYNMQIAYTFSTFK